MYKFFILLSTISIILFAQPCMTNIYTLNGINTSDPEARENMKELSKVMLKYTDPAYRLDTSKENVDFNFTYVHNPTYGALDDMQETYHGLLESGQISKGFFDFMFTLSTLTSTEEEALEQYAKIITTYDIDVSSITKAYRNRSFDKQNNVLLVAHSQGNIVGNKVYTQLTSTEKSKFRMVSVGTPADHVAGVKYINEDQHVTGYLDFVINNPFIPNNLSSTTIIS